MIHHSVVARTVGVLFGLALLGCSSEEPASGSAPAPPSFIVATYQSPPTSADSLHLIALGVTHIERIRVANALTFRSTKGGSSFTSAPYVLARVMGDGPTQFVPIEIYLADSATTAEVQLVDFLSTYPHATSLLSSTCIFSWFHVDDLDELLADANVRTVTIDDNIVEVSQRPLIASTGRTR